MMREQHLLDTTVKSTSRLPDFDSSGHLPVGIHFCSLSEFGHAVRFNEQRRKMWQQLASFLVLPTMSRKFSAAYVGGGFVSTHAKPTDIDVILETTSPYGPEALAAVAQFFAIGLDKIKMLYGVHLQFWMRDAPSGLNDYRVFFQYDRPDDFTHVLNRSRGVARIDLAQAGILGRLRRYIRGDHTACVPLVGATNSQSLHDGIEKLDGVKKPFAFIGETASKMVIISDAQGRIEWVNEAFVAQCGYTLPEALGRKPGELLQGPASDPEVLKLLRQALSNAQECDCRLINYRKNGSPYLAHVSLAPLFENRDLKGFLAVVEDLGNTEIADIAPRHQTVA